MIQTKDIHNTQIKTNTQNCLKDRLNNRKSSSKFYKITTGSEKKIETQTDQHNKINTNQLNHKDKFQLKGVEKGQIRGIITIQSKTTNSSIKHRRPQTQTTSQKKPPQKRGGNKNKPRIRKKTTKNQKTPRTPNSKTTPLQKIKEQKIRRATTNETKNYENTIKNTHCTKTISKNQYSKLTHKITKSNSRRPMTTAAPSGKPRIWKERRKEYVKKLRKKDLEFRSTSGGTIETTSRKGSPKLETIVVIPSLHGTTFKAGGGRIPREAKNTNTSNEENSLTLSTEIIEWYINHPEGNPYLEVIRGCIAGENQQGTKELMNYMLVNTHVHIFRPTSVESPHITNKWKHQGVIAAYITTNTNQYRTIIYTNKVDTSNIKETNTNKNKTNHNNNKNKRPNSHQKTINLAINRSNTSIAKKTYLRLSKPRMVGHIK
jgi:hypothetical protein